MRVADARSLLPDAEYRAPAQRGDFDALPDASVVGLIDGRFEQSLSLSQREVHNAVLRGISILGSSSMGALRASEVRGVEGVGRIYEMYRDGIIDRDDEVALIYDEERLHAYTVPLINVRYAVQSLVRAGTIGQAIGSRILRAAEQLHYSERRYKAILHRAGLLRSKDADQLMEFLEGYDLKKEDAHLLLEQMPRFFAERRGIGVLPGMPKPVYSAGEVSDHFSDVTMAVELSADGPVLIWEYGDLVAFDDLLLFLKATGEFEANARQAVSRFLFDGNEVKADVPADIEAHLSGRDDLLLQTSNNWGWRTAEELKVTLRDLGVGYRDLRVRLQEEVAAHRALAGLALKSDPAFKKALRSQLLMNGLSLKRAALRCASLAYYAKRGRDSGEPLCDADRNAARAILRHTNRASQDIRLTQHLRLQGVSKEQVDRFVDELAYARRGARHVAQCLWAPEAISPAKLPAKMRRTLQIGPTPKAQGSRRFAMPAPQASRIAKRLAKSIGVTRIGMIGELSGLGVEIAQAYRPHSSWSSTSGSGKGLTRSAAQVGAVMEEIEKFAQDMVDYEPVVGSYSEMRSRTATIDPGTLDLPYDSVYEPDLEMSWVECADLLGGQTVHMPAAALDKRRLANDIYYSRRLGRKSLSTNGLASGFAAAEALLHATCEFIERHALRLAELVLANPGGLGPCGFSFVDLATLPKSPARLVRMFKQTGYTTRVLDITSEIRVPTFWAWLYPPGLVPYSGGYATHPDPAVALEMALFEAAQTVAGNSAGAREDLTIKARSLGRHERPSPVGERFLSFVFGECLTTKPLDAVPHLVSDSIRAELEWVLGALAAAGVEHVVAHNLTNPKVRPAHVFRVIIPGLESNNPFYIGPRARACAIRQLLDPARFDPIT